MIATADKFAALPWSGETARFFHGGDPDHPRPPDLIIQDELHLISGPLGTMAGLYETAIDRLCTRRTGDETVAPQGDRSTATVRLAQKQIQALFNRREVDCFPGPGARPAQLLLRPAGIGERGGRAPVSRRGRAGAEGRRWSFSAA